MAALREILVAFGITVDTAPIKKGEQAADNFKDKLKQVGGAIAAAFALDKVTDFVMGMVAAGDAVGDQAARLNLSSQALEEWTYAAQFADLQAGELDGIFNKLAKSSVEAGDANSEQAKTLAKLGVQVKDANGNFKDTGTLFEEVGLALAGMGDQTERTALSMQFFGKAAGPKVLQLFKEGPEGIRKFREEFEALGGGMGDFVEQAGAIDDQMHRLDLAWVSAKARIVGLLLPAVSWLAIGMTKGAAAIAYLAKNSYLLQAALGVLGAVAATSAAPVIAAWAPVVAPFLLWALAIAGVVLLFEDLIVMFKGGDSVVGRAIDKLFGEGSTAKVVAWTQGVAKAFAGFLDGTYSVGVSTVRSALDLIGMAFASNATESEKFEASFMRHSQVVGEAIDGIIEKLSILKDMFNWDTFKQGVNDALDLAESAVSAVTGSKTRRDLANEKTYESSPIGGPLTADSIRSAFAPIPASASAGYFSSPSGGAGVQYNTTVNQTLPPGTSAETARAAKDATMRALKARPNAAAAAALKGRT